MLLHQGLFEFERLDEHGKIKGAFGQVQHALGLVVVGLDVFERRGGEKGDVSRFGGELLGLQTGGGCKEDGEGEQFFHG